MSQGYPFTKLEGCGNSIVVLDAEDIPSQVDWVRASQLILNQSRGIGADGVMVTRRTKPNEFSIFGYNPDGSDQGMCGNGLRCIARYLYLTEQLSGASNATFIVGDRRVTCHLNQTGDEFTLNMGPPEFDPKKIPMAMDQEAIEQTLKIGEQSYKFTAVSMGNPHCVIFVPAIDRIDLKKIGPMIEHNQLFPARTNVEFVEQISPTSLRVAVWERGAGITLACGSGACATVVAAVRTGRVAAGVECKVELPGGELKVRWDRDVYLTGPAVEVCKGVLEPRFLST